MNSRTALLFPGQGAYVPGVFADMADSYHQIGAVLRDVDEVAAEFSRAPVSPVLLDSAAPPIDELVANDPPRSHLAIFATCVASHRVLTEAHGLNADVLVGHSFGEIAALTAAGAFDVATGARIVAERDVAFDHAKPSVGGLLGLRIGTTRATSMIAAAGVWRVVVAAENSPRQTVLSGPDAELAVIEAMARQAGVLARRLRAPHAFHNPMLREVTEIYAQRIAYIPMRSTAIRTYSPILGRYYRADDDLRSALAHHVDHPVRFGDAVRTLFADGVDTLVECGARSILTDLASENLPGLHVMAPLRHRVDATEFTARLNGFHSPRVQKPTVPAPRTQSPDPQPSNVSVPANDELVELLRQEYAAALDYPPEVFTDDADLEADLGIDSIKQTEMFSRLRERFSLPPTEEVRITAHRTLLDVAKLLSQLAVTR